MIKFKILFLSLSLFFLATALKAQTSLTFAEDFMAKTTDGVTRTLFPILDEGNIVVLTFFTTT